MCLTGCSRVEVLHLPPSPDLSLDAVYTHDPSLATDHGLIGLNPGKPNRIAEARRHVEFCRSLGIPLLGEIQPPGTTEAGDIVWLDSRTLLIGNGYRTNTAGIAQMRALLGSKAWKSSRRRCLTVPDRPPACTYVADQPARRTTALVDLPWLAVETVELLKARGYRFIEIEYSERETMACNVLSLGESACLRSRRIGKPTKNSGIPDSTSAFPGSELCINGGGGPTCLTRPSCGRM